MILSMQGTVFMPMRLAFLGPEGTYGERAAREMLTLEDIPDGELVACTGLRAVVDHVADGRCAGLPASDSEQPDCRLTATGAQPC